MDPPKGFDPNQGYWQDQDGHWYPLPVRAHLAFQHEGSESANTGPSEGPPTTPAGPPRPRPVVRPMGTPGPAPFQVSPHVPYYHPYPHSPYTPHAPTSSTNQTPPTLFAASLDPPPLPLARPSGAAAPTPAALPESSGTPASSAAKGKKRAADADADAATKKPKAAAPKASAKGKGKQIAGKVSKAKSGDTVKSGRAPGSFNYNDADLEALLDVVEGLLPIGMNSWTQVMNDFNQWAAENGRPNRTQKPLKTKFEALARTPKPTSSAEVPPHVERAYEIEQLINEHAATRDLDDDDIADGDVDGDELAAVEDVDADLEDDEVEVLDGPPAKAASAAPGPVLKTFTVASTTTSTPPPAGSRTGSSRTASSSRRAQTTEFMGAVTSSLDPMAREARDEARFACNLARDELSRLTQDNRDLHARNDTLQDRLHQQSQQLQQSINEATRLQARVEMLEMMSSLTGMAGVRGRPQGRARDYDDACGTPTRYRSYSHTYYHERSPGYSTEWRSPAHRHHSSRPSPPSRRVDDAKAEQ